MEEIRAAITPEVEKAFDEYNIDEVFDWCLPFPRQNIIRSNAPKRVIENARKIDEILFKRNGKHGWRNFITDPKELKAFDDHVEWALQQPTE